MAEEWNPKNPNPPESKPLDPLEWLIVTDDFQPCEVCGKTTRYRSGLGSPFCQVCRDLAVGKPVEMDKGYRDRVVDIETPGSRDRGKEAEFLVHLSVVWDGFLSVEEAGDFSDRVMTWLNRSHVP